jgi:hypothetical protein
MRITILSALVILLAACGGNGAGEGDPEYYIRATVTMTDGTTFEFYERCDVSDLEMSGEVTWGIQAVDPSVPVGLVISWKETWITGPGTHDVNEGLMDLTTMVVREHPTDPSQIRMSGATDGTLVFEQVGYSSGSLIDGTFDNVRLDRDEPDDTVHILATSGEFHCRVE